MLGGQRNVEANVWWPIYKGPSSGFIYVTNLMDETISFKWKIGSAAPPFYLKSSRSIAAGEKVAIWFGVPTPYVKFSILSSKDIVLFVG